MAGFAQMQEDDVESGGVSSPFWRAIYKMLGVAYTDSRFVQPGEHQVDLSEVPGRDMDSSLGETMQRAFPFEGVFEGRSLEPVTGWNAEQREWKWHYVRVLDHHALIDVIFEVAVSAVSSVLGIVSDLMFAMSLQSSPSTQLAFTTLLVSSLVAWIVAGVWQTQCDTLMKGKYVHSEGISFFSQTLLRLKLLFLYLIGVPLVLLDIGLKTVWQRKVQSVEQNNDNFIIGLAYASEAGMMADNMRGTKTRLVKFLVGDFWMLFISINFQLSQGITFWACVSCLLKVLSGFVTMLKLAIWLQYDRAARHSTGIKWIA